MQPGERLTSCCCPLDSVSQGSQLVGLLFGAEGGLVVVPHFHFLSALLDELVEYSIDLLHLFQERVDGSKGVASLGRALFFNKILSSVPL